MGMVGGILGGEVPRYGEWKCDVKGIGDEMEKIRLNGVQVSGIGARQRWQVRRSEEQVVVPLYSLKKQRIRHSIHVNLNKIPGRAKHIQCLNTTSKLMKGYLQT